MKIKSPRPNPLPVWRGEGVGEFEPPYVGCYLFNGLFSATLCGLCASALKQFLALNPLHRPAGVFGNQRFGVFGGLPQVGAGRRRRRYCPAPRRRSAANCAILFAIS